MTTSGSDILRRTSITLWPRVRLTWHFGGAKRIYEAQSIFHGHPRRRRRGPRNLVPRRGRRAAWARRGDRRRRRARPERLQARHGLPRAEGDAGVVGGDVL